MRSIGSALVLPEGTIPKIVLSGDVLNVELLGHSIKDGWNAVVKYPDGKILHHQVSDVIGLLDKITGQLKTRYNLTDFKFTAIPQALEPSTITIGEIKYA